MKKTILSLLVALMATTGTWADNFFLEVDGTSATLKYGDKGNNPYLYLYYGSMTWSATDFRSTVNTITVDASCASHVETSLQNLFYGCSALTTINGLDNLKTTGITDMRTMFYGCSTLTELDLSSFNTASVTNMMRMFMSCSKLTTIYVGDGWDVTGVTTSTQMFYSCSKLPNYNSSYDDKTKAHTGDGGYLKTKPAPAGPATSGITWNASTNSGTFLMPAYDVEVTTELWYRLSQTEDNTAYQTKTNVFLERTLQAGGWNTFCAPFAIADPASVFGEGVQVKAFTGSVLSPAGTLTLYFDDAKEIAAATPYLIKLPGESNVDLTADGKEFEGVTQNWTPVDVNPNDGLATFKAVLEPTELNGGDKTVLFVTGGDKLTYPKNTGNINAFRAYFQLSQAVEARAFRMSFDDVATGISLTPNPSPKGEGSIYSLDGRKYEKKPTQKGVYIVNGKKTIIK